MEPVDNLPDGLAAPARRALIGAGYRSLDQLEGAARSELAELHGMGPRALRTIEGALEKAGLRPLND